MKLPAVLLKALAKETSVRVAFESTLLLGSWLGIALRRRDLAAHARRLPMVVGRSSFGELLAASRVSVHALFGLLVLIELIPFARLARQVQKKRATTGMCLMLVGTR